MRIKDARITGIYKLLTPLEKAGFRHEVREYSGGVWAYIYLKKTWFYGYFSYWSHVGELWFKDKSGWDETYLNVDRHWDEVIDKLKQIPEFENILIKLRGAQDVGGSRMVETK